MIKIAKSWDGANFIKLLSRKSCLEKIYAKQNMGGAPDNTTLTNNACVNFLDSVNFLLVINLC